VAGDVVHAGHVQTGGGGVIQQVCRVSFNWRWGRGGGDNEAGDGRFGGLTIAELLQEGVKGR